MKNVSPTGGAKYLVYQMGDGELPVYEKGEHPAYIIGEEGQNILIVTKPKRVIFPLFEIACETNSPRAAAIHVKTVIEDRVEALWECLAEQDGPAGPGTDLMVVAIRTGLRARKADSGAMSWWMTCGIGCFKTLAPCENKAFTRTLKVRSKGLLDLPTKWKGPADVDAVRKVLFGKLSGCPKELTIPETGPHGIGISFSAASAARASKGL